VIRDRRKIEFSDEKILLNYPINLLATQGFPFFLLLLLKIFSRVVASICNHTGMPFSL